MGDAIDNIGTAIPAYPLSRPLEQGDKGLFDPLFAALQPRVSEFTFANLFLFRRPHEYRVTRIDDALVILGKTYGGAPFFFPPVGARGDAIADSLLREGMTLAGIDTPAADRISGRWGADVDIVENRDDFDYLYLRDELAQLQGNRYHKKKNRVNYFTSRHEHRVEIYDPRHLAGCFALLDEWRRVRQEAGSASLEEEARAAGEALRLAHFLGLEGVVVLVGGQVKAFALGERLNRDTSVCHFEKADPFLEGISQLVDREFCRLLFTDCTYVNREQDLGEPGLREAKLSYHPVELVKKYLVRMRKIHERVPT